MFRYLNKYSKKITNDKSQGASQAMLYALKFKKKDFKKPQISIGSNWFQGNPCNNHLNILSSEIKKSITNSNLIGFEYNTIGVSDGITNGTKGMLYSLPSREIIADSYETMNIAHSYDANIAIPGCDKNLPGCLMGMIRINRPSFMIYGGSIKPGKFRGKSIDIVDAFQSYGKFMTGFISENERLNIVKKACPGSGSCGGMYTANTMATAIETMGMMLPYSSSNPALSKEKFKECKESGKVIENLLKNDIKPLDIINDKSIKNAITIAIALGGSTNLVIHMLAIAKTANIKLNIEDFNDIGKNIPLIANLKPHGKYLMNDIHNIGGIPIIQKLLISEGLLDGDCLTITGKTLSENIKHVDIKNIDDYKHIIDFKNPIKKNSHIKILKGNLSPNGAVAKISGKEGEFFEGIANVFESETDFIKGLEDGLVNEGDVIVIRNQGPKGGPGMPEMLKPTSAIVGYGLSGKVAFITDGRFSGGSHGFIVGHVSPESYVGGPISKVNNGDKIVIDTINNKIQWIRKNKKNNNYLHNINEHDINNSYLQKYRKLVRSSHEGCVTL